MSRKAEVCEDFVRGYCPQGDKVRQLEDFYCKTQVIDYLNIEEVWVLKLINK